MLRKKVAFQISQRHEGHFYHLETFQVAVDSVNRGYTRTHLTAKIQMSKGKQST